VSSTPPALRLGPVPDKYDKIYVERGDTPDTRYQVNPRRLECSCPDWIVNRARFEPDDVRRVCSHLYGRLPKVTHESSSIIANLMIRYGRTMLSVQIVEADFGTLVIGQPFGPSTVRALGEVYGRAVMATYDANRYGWSNREGEVPPEHAEMIFGAMRSAFPSVFG
jgi:hypothetical protein